MSGAPARRQVNALASIGSTTDSQNLGARLAHAAKHAHLVSPATGAAELPDGCSAVLTQVLIDVERETYNVGGKRGLSKVALERIAAAAGVSWDYSASGRIDDGSDPYYCAWRAVGSYRHFDGTEVHIEGSKEMDLREGSPQLDALYERARNGRSKDPSAQIREMRLHIMAHAESKAKLRAVRSMGIRGAYEPAELSKPFVVARLMFTGRSEDPETRRLFAGALAQSMLGGRRALYGDDGHAGLPAPRAVQALPATTKVGGTPPPPVGQSHQWDDDDDLPESWNQAPARAEQRQAAPQQTRQREPGDDDVEPPQRERVSGFTIPGGREKGTPIEDASDDSVQWWANRIAENLDAGEARYPDKDQRLLDALRAELEARR